MCPKFSGIRLLSSLRFASFENGLTSFHFINVACYKQCWMVFIKIVNQFHNSSLENAGFLFGIFQEQRMRINKVFYSHNRFLRCHLHTFFLFSFNLFSDDTTGKSKTHQIQINAPTNWNFHSPPHTIAAII